MHIDFRIMVRSVKHRSLRGCIVHHVFSLRECVCACMPVCLHGFHVCWLHVYNVLLWLERPGFSELHSATSWSLVFLQVVGRCFFFVCVSTSVQASHSVASAQAC